MSHEVICSWLGVSTDHWPPDHYLLLDLPPGESDSNRIEEAVEKRLETVRQYQLTHPEQATEAMNRIAQAFVCLTDTKAKQAYDQKLFQGSAVTEKPTADPSADLRSEGQQEQEESANADAMAVNSEPVLWLNQALRAMKSSTTTLEVPMTPSDDTTKERVVTPEAEPQPEPVEEAAPIDEAENDLLEVEDEQKQIEAEKPQTTDPAIEAARTASAQKGLATRRAFYYRLARTRALIDVWEALKEYLHDPTRRLGRPAEAKRLMRHLTELRQELANFPPLLGKAGQAGYLVVSLARQQVVVPTYQTLLPSQREALARDWEAGYRVLIAHKAFIRQELQTLRKKSWLGRRIRTIRTYLNDNPLGMLAVVALVALAVALWRQMLED